MTVYGAPHVDTAQKEFGTGSAVFDGNINKYLDVSGLFDWSGGVGADFTVDFWYRLSSTTTCCLLNTDGYWYFYYISGTGLQVTITLAAGMVVLTGDELATDTWQHVAVVRSGYDFYLFQDGALTASGNSTYGLPEEYGDTYIGNSLDGSSPLLGWIDEVRFSKIARWTTNFSPPGSEHSPDGYTMLLLHCNGVNGSTSFLDDSASFHEGSLVVTSYGDTQVDTAQKEFGTGSALFNGSSISTPSDSNFDFGTGDFTIDLWVYLLNLYGALMACGDIGKMNWDIDSGGTIHFGRYSVDAVSSPVGSVPLSTWAHVAITRAGGVLRMFVNGVKVKEQVYAVDLMTDYLHIAHQPTRTFSSETFYNAYLDEIRISKGIARWTVDFAPPAAAYTADEYVKLLLHCDETTPLFVESSPVSIGKRVSVCDNVKVFVDTNQKKFGTGSAFFDGSIGYLSVPDSPDFDFGSGDFTIDMWVKFGRVSWQYFLTINDTVWGVSFYTSTNVAVGIYTNIGWITLTGTNPGTSNWTHIALVRYGNVWTLYQDGVATATQTQAATVITGAGNLAVGRAGNPGSDPYFLGRLDEIRVSKGIARWTENFTPSVAEYTADSYTKLLLHCNGTYGSTTFTDSSALAHDVTIEGSVRVDTNLKKFGTGAAKFLRNDCYLTIPDSQDFDFLDSDFTVDFWVYLTSTGNYQTIFSRSVQGAWLIQNIGATMYFRATSTGSSNDVADKSMGTIDVGVWTHYAVTRRGVNFYTFKNGVLVNTWASSLAILDSSNQAVIGHDRDTGACITGWLDELRIVKGTALWTDGFTPPVRSYRIPSQGQMGLLATDGCLYLYDGTTWRKESSASTFVGTIIAWTTATPPTGYLECDGSALSRTTYADLFTVIGTTYGNSDETDFRLPDYRGCFHRSWADGSANDPNRTIRMDRGDSTTGDIVGTRQSDEFESHNHDSVEDLVADIWGYYSPLTSGWIPNPPYPDGWGYGVDVGGNETRPKNVNVMYCIKY
jgi:hypothetical protein